MFGNGPQKAEIPLIIVCDEKDMAYANFLIQLIGQKDDAGDSVVGIEDGSVSAAIYTTKNYKDNLPQIPSTQHILFVGLTSEAKEQSKTIEEKFNKLGMHYGWLGKRAVLYVEDTSGGWITLKDKQQQYRDFLSFSEERGITHTDALSECVERVVRWKTAIAAVIHIGVGFGKTVLDLRKALSEIKAQQYRTLIKVFYEDGLKSFVEG